jgi:hypothetical protein
VTIIKLIIISSIVIGAVAVTIKLFMADTDPRPMRDDSKLSARGPLMAALRVFAVIVGIGVVVAVAYGFIILAR